MGVFEALIGELRSHYTGWVFAGLVVTLALVRLLARGTPRLGSMTLLCLGHVAAALAAGFLVLLDPAAYRVASVLAGVLGGVAAVGMAGLLVFGVLLPRLRVRVPPILSDVVVAIAALVAIFIVASRAGLNLSGLIATSAVMTAVIGFSLQDTLANVMGGLALEIDDTVEVGDWVKVGDQVGKVIAIRWRTTAIETRNWETVIIPNSVLARNQVMVLGRRQGAPQQWRRWIWFNVDFRYSPTDVIRAVDEALQARPIDAVALDPAPHCLVMDFKDSTARYAARYWLTDLARDDGTDSQVRQRLFTALQRARIPLSIPAQALFVTEESSERRTEKRQREHERGLEVLEHIELFALLSDGERRRLAGGLRYAPFVQGETVTRQGAVAHWLYIIAEGEVSVRVAVEREEREVARLSGGSFFGEMGLLTGEPRTASVVALTDVECYRLDKSVFQEVLQARPGLAEQVAALLAERRVQIDAIREHLDAAARSRRVVTTRTDILGQIRDFFGLGDSRS